MPILRNFARSIREKATDMALGLVQPNRDLGTTATPRATNDTQTPKHHRKRLISFSNATCQTTINVRYFKLQITVQSIRFILKLNNKFQHGYRSRHTRPCIAPI